MKISDLDLVAKIGADDIEVLDKERFNALNHLYLNRLLIYKAQSDFSDGKRVRDDWEDMPKSVVNIYSDCKSDLPHGEQWPYFSVDLVTGANLANFLHDACLQHGLYMKKIPKNRETSSQ